MKHHAGVEPPVIEKPLRSKLMREVCKDKWDATFIDELAVKRQVLYDLILAANYMEVKSLLHLGCAKVVCVCLCWLNSALSLGKFDQGPTSGEDQGHPGRRSGRT